MPGESDRKFYFLGINGDGEAVYYVTPTWDCDWYWGFGYLYVKGSHTHLSSMPHPEKCFYDRLQDYFPNGYNVPERNQWEFAELISSAYLLKETAEMFHRGGCNLTVNPFKDTIRDSEKEREINEEILPKIFFRITTLLTLNEL